MNKLLLIPFVLIFATCFILLGYSAWLDWKEGAIQTGTLDDGTIWIWDRFGNRCRVVPYGEPLKIIVDKDHGLGKFAEEVNNVSPS